MELLNTLGVEFVTFSFLGWAFETLVRHRSASNWRGGILRTKKSFTLGPFKVVYGVAAMIIIEGCRPFLDQPLLVFALAFLLASIVELATSLMLRHMFHKTLWDYSKSHVFNVAKGSIGGHISIVVSFVWGVLSCFGIFVILPYLDRLASYLFTNYGATPALVASAIVTFCAIVAMVVAKIRK